MKIWRRGKQLERYVICSKNVRFLIFCCHYYSDKMSRNRICSNPWTLTSMVYISPKRNSNNSKWFQQMHRNNRKKSCIRHCFCQFVRFCKTMTRNITKMWSKYGQFIDLFVRFGGSLLISLWGWGGVCWQTLVCKLTWSAGRCLTSWQRTAAPVKQDRVLKGQLSCWRLS